MVSKTCLFAAGSVYLIRQNLKCKLGSKNHHVEIYPSLPHHLIGSSTDIFF